MPAFYPPASFHFNVTFQLPGVGARDSAFTDVSGLSATVSTDPYHEGGENRFEHQFPTKIDFSTLSLKRGLVTDSAVINWIRATIEDFLFVPIQVTITLLNNEHLPVKSWVCVNCYPKKWEIDGFSATSNAYAVESIELEYQYFRTVTVPGADTLRNP